MEIGLILICLIAALVTWRIAGGIAAKEGRGGLPTRAERADAGYIRARNYARARRAQRQGLRLTAEEEYAIQTAYSPHNTVTTPPEWSPVEWTPREESHELQTIYNRARHQAREEYHDWLDGSGDPPSPTPQRVSSDIPERTQARRR